MPEKSKNIICSINSDEEKIGSFILEEEKLDDEEVFGDNLYKVTVYLNTQDSTERVFRHDFATNVDKKREAKKSMIYPTSEQEYQNIISNLKNTVKRQSKIIISNINSIASTSESIETTGEAIDVKNVKIKQIKLNGTKGDHNFKFGLSVSLKFEDKNIKSKYKCNWLIIDKLEDEGFGYDDMFGGKDINPDNLKDSIRIFRNNL